MKHKKVIEEWYEISFSAPYRTLPAKLNEFLSDAPDLSDCEATADELWEENTTTLRDYEGDFEGHLIYHNDITEGLIKFICNKIDVDYESVKGINFKLVG